MHRPRSPLPRALGSYVFEPDPAVLAAGLVGTLAAEHGLAAAAPGLAYLVGERPLDDPALACFQVIESMPFDLKRLRQWLGQRGIGRLEIKKRGVTEEPEQIRRRLHLRGDAAAVLLVAPLSQGVTAILRGGMWPAKADSGHGPPHCDVPACSFCRERVPRAVSM